MRDPPRALPLPSSLHPPRSARTGFRTRRNAPEDGTPRVIRSSGPRDPDKRIHYLPCPRRLTLSHLRPLVLCLLVLVEAGLVHASQAARAAPAIELGKKGLQAYAERAWEPAYRSFQAADAFAHWPVFTLYMARCQRN